MIEEPPLLTIRSAKNRNRPSDAQIDAFRDVPTGFICDALAGSAALAGGIAPLAADLLPSRLCGPALTVQSGPDDNLALLAALTEVQPGDILVTAVDGWQGSAAVGDSILGMAKNSGAAGFVTDGRVRDLDGILGVGLPLFCTGLTPNSPFGKGPGSVGLPVQIGGRPVESGDMIVGDRDGVVVVPFTLLNEVIESLAHIATLEKDRDARVAEGQKCPSDILDLVASDQVKWV